MFLTKALLFTLFLLPLAAQASPCLDGKQVEDMIREFNILKTSENINVDLCDSRSMVYTTIQGLLFLKNLGQLDPVDSRLNKNWMGSSPYEFFRARVKKIVLDDNSDCVGLSQVWPSERPMGIMHICTKATGYETLVVSEAMVHEARHLERENHDHAICISGELYNRESCDESYESGGAYAIGVEFLMKIYNTSRLDNVLREKAHAMADKALRERFNTAPAALSISVSMRPKERPKIFR
jgi:hypothetical protein